MIEPERIGGSAIARGRGGLRKVWKEPVLISHLTSYLTSSEVSIDAHMPAIVSV